MDGSAAVQDYGSFLDQYVEAENIDQNEVSSGGEYELPKAGRAFMRLVEYVELGSHQEDFQGVPKKSLTPLCRVTVELSGKNYPAADVEGVKFPMRMGFTMGISSNDKAKFYKLFRALNGMHGNKYKHMAQMAADNIAFIGTISHNSNGKEGKDKREYANLWDNSQWPVEAPMKRIFNEDDEEDTEGTLVPLTVAPALSPTRIFLFNAPRLVDWAKLYIEGTREDGSSKNWMQDLILSAGNFNGSALDALLQDIPVPTGESKPAEAKAKPAKKAKAVDPVDDI
jgi:hypothetical protein